MSKSNYNVTMQSGTDEDGSKYVILKIDDINANFGLSSTGKSNKVAYGKVYFKDSRYRNVTVQLNAFRTPPSN